MSIEVRNGMKIIGSGKRAGNILGLLAVFGTIAAAQTFHTTVPGDVMDQFRAQRTAWTTNVWVYANSLFGILALIEFAWSAAVMLLERTDLQSWTAALIRKIMWIGAFYALLLNGRIWIPAIIDSFTQIGQNAAGTGALSPSDVFVQGLTIAGALMDGASTSEFFKNPGSAFALVFAALLIVVSYTIITINFIVTIVESYLVVSVGFIFLGFGGSRWTVPYTERYIGLAVSIGIKVLLLYCLISAGMGLGVGWATEAEGVGTSPRPSMTAFDVMGAAVIFMMVCWQIPKLFSAVLGGAPALSGGDLVSTVTGMVAGGVMVGSLGAGAAAMGARGVSAISAVAAAAGTGDGPSGAGGSIISPNGPRSSPNNSGGPSGTVPPPSPGGATDGARARQPDPPVNGPGVDTVNVAAASGVANGSSAPTSAAINSSPATGPLNIELNADAGPARSLSGAGSQLNGFRQRLRGFPSDAAPLASPPRMPVDQQE